MNRTIITVIGKDRVGIIATVCTYLAKHKINILDIDQSIIQGYFHMMMTVDANGADKEFASLVKDLEKIVKILVFRSRCSTKRFLTSCIEFNKGG